MVFCDFVTEKDDISFYNNLRKYNSNLIKEAQL